MWGAIIADGLHLCYIETNRVLIISSKAFDAFCYAESHAFAKNPLD